MAEKIKEIREISSEPKEIEEEEGEETLEEEVESEGEQEDFSEFMGGERTAPVLEPTPIPDTGTEEPLEEELEGVPSTIPDTDTTGADYAINMPDYGTETLTYEGQTEEKREFEIRDFSEVSKERTTDRFDLRSFEQDSSLLPPEERVERELRKYEELRRIEEQEERKVPFERRERKRERILK